ncbi:cation:dicarboxylase symporter family transporter [Nocardioides sp. ChNu-153]|uniref:cation:dicarboxylate symporter family transporter n=1 Tax=Nocardioides sp. ChNu-153 TaxID=2779364 RepID=UPI00264DBD6A|nr:cation:dicarboxylase symporter family transporter [Nocardioides sp. ChNu-153]MDN7121732.1 cation:dicarboxylase symporter family transporter [Nocardioides sp. ChNu-153]
MSSSTTAGQAPVRRKARTHFLYIAVIVAVALGIAVGILAPSFAVELEPIGKAFVALIKMMIQPVIFCTIVLGVGSIRSAAQVGKVGGLALAYFITMSTFALGIGLVVGNLVHPGEGLRVNDSVAASGAEYAEKAGHATTADFLLSIIPTSLVSSLTSGSVLQTLFVALLVGFALQAMGRAGEPILTGVGHVQRLVFRVLAMIMWAAPIGAFAAIAAVVGATGAGALKSLAVLMLGFYATCAIFVFVVLGALLKVSTGINIFTLLKYLGREFLLIVSTSSSESALPRLIAKMEHAGVDKPTVGVVVPTGYSFNLDGTAIYLTMASLFIASALGDPLSIGDQVSLLLFMMIASKGAAGVTGAGLATLAGGLSSHRPEMVDGVGLIVGIDRFMSEARAVTNFAGNAVATVLIGHWTGGFDREKFDAAVSGRLPFDEETMLDEHGHDHGHGAVDHAEAVAANAKADHQVALSKDAVTDDRLAAR